MATLHLIVGFLCSGKTTFAKKMEQELPALRLTPDEWHLRLFGNDVENTEHNDRHYMIESLLWTIAERALVLGLDVILDFGFWAKVEREDYRSRVAKLGAASEIHFLDFPEQVLIERLEKRNKLHGQSVVYIPIYKFKEWIPIFQAPTSDELMRRE
jgi:predicted kinase